MSEAKYPLKHDQLLGAISGIAEKLKQFYQAAQEEPIPEKFLTLLEQLDKASVAADETTPKTPSIDNNETIIKKL